MLFHLTSEVLAGAGIGQIQAVFVEQHGLVLEPGSPGFFAHIFIDAFAEFAGIGCEVQALGFLAEFDAVDGTCHGDSL